MRKKTLLALGSLTCAALLSLPAVARENPAPGSHQTTTQSTKATRNAWPPETIKGTVMMVNPAERLVVVKDSSGIPFDMIVNHSTRIESGNQKLNLDQLKADVHKNVSVNFVPERAGDMARLIQVNG